MPNGDLVVAGGFTSIQGVAVRNIARRSAGIWGPLGTGVGGSGLPQVLAVMPNGDLIAGGNFDEAGGVPAACVARWNGSTWSPLGGGLSGSQWSVFLGVRALLVRPNGELIAAGHFLDAGGVAVANIAAWNGSTWSPLAGGIPGAFSPYAPSPVVNGLANLPNGDLVATGGALAIQRWDGGVWSAMNAGLIGWSSLSTGPQHLFVSSAGSLFACGTEPLPPNYSLPFVKQWNGSAWINHGSGLPSTGTPLALAELPSGEIVVGGQTFGSSTTINGVVLRSDGSAWLPIAVSQAQSMAMQADGRLRIVGGGSVSELVSSCPASVASVGSACAGSLGTHTLTASSLPWLGGTFRAVAGGVPTSAVALAVSSLSPTTLPLSVLTPVAGAGCEGLVVADLTELLLPSGNQVTSSLVLPMNPAVVGLAVHHYVAVLDFGAGGTPISLTSTARLALTLGLF